MFRHCWYINENMKHEVLQNALRVSAIQVMISKAGSLFLTARYTCQLTFHQLISSFYWAYYKFYSLAEFLLSLLIFFFVNITLFFVLIQIGWCKCLQAKALAMQPNASLSRWHVPMTSKGLTMCTNTSLRCIFLGRKQRTLCCFRPVAGTICAQLKYK